MEFWNIVTREHHLQISRQVTLWVVVGLDARKERSGLGILITNSDSEGFKSKKAPSKGFFRENK